MTYHRPTFVSERERAHRWPDGRWDNDRWEDCAPCSVVMMVDATTAGRKPATKSLTEAEALRAAAGYGPTGGTNIQQLAATAVTRYRITLPRYASGWGAVWTMLRPGWGGAIAGNLGAFPPGHRLRRFDTSFSGPHSVYVQRESTTERVWWVDPLGPRDGTYRGEWVSKADLRIFLGGAVCAITASPLVAA